MKADQLKAALEAKYAERKEIIERLQREVFLTAGQLDATTLSAINQAKQHALKRLQEEQDKIDERVFHHQIYVHGLQNTLKDIPFKPKMTSEEKTKAFNELRGLLSSSSKQEVPDIDDQLIEMGLDAAFDVWETKIHAVSHRLRLQATLNDLEANFRREVPTKDTIQNSSFSLNLLAALPIALGITMLIGGAFALVASVATGVGAIVAGTALIGTGFFMARKYLSTPKELLDQSLSPQPAV